MPLKWLQPSAYWEDVASNKVRLPKVPLSPRCADHFEVHISGKKLGRVKGGLQLQSLYKHPSQHFPPPPQKGMGAAGEDEYVCPMDLLAVINPRQQFLSSRQQARLPLEVWSVARGVVAVFSLPPTHQNFLSGKTWNLLRTNFFGVLLC